MSRTDPRVNWNLRPVEPMKENLPPGPKRRRRRAVDGTLCPPGADVRRYRAERPFLTVCRKGHPKPHPGRCVPCRRASDKARDLSARRAEVKAAAAKRWAEKRGAKEQRAAEAKRRNARREQKDAAARRAWEARHGITRRPGAPKAVAEKLKALAAARAVQAGYGIQRIGYQEVR